jgi:DNA-directed RNA polymerase specialized sigma24 family protein
VIRATEQDPQPGPAPPGDRYERTSLSSVCDLSEMICIAAIDVAKRLRMPAESAIGAAAAEDVRAQAIAATWAAIGRRPTGFLDDRGRVCHARLAAYIAMQLRKSLSECARRRWERPLDELVEGGTDLTLMAVLEREAERELSLHIDRLSARSRDVVQARRAGWSYQRIAIALGIRRNTAMQRYRRAKQIIPTGLHSLLPASREHGS